jgi:hypothetical protein
MNSVRKLRVHWPISAETFAQIAAGETEVLKQDKGLSTLLQAVEQFQDLGDFGNYKHVFESGVGFEGFTCAAGAAPTLGEVGKQTFSPTFVYTTYFNAALEDAIVEQFLSRIVDIHPWELPVIELTGPVSVAASAEVKEQKEAATS